jgi:hypothetical protein
MRFFTFLITVLLLFGVATSAQAQLQNTSLLAPPDVRAWS